MLMTGKLWRHGWVLMLLAPLYLVAQNSPDPAVLSLSLEDLTRVKVFTASRHLEEQRNAPASVTIITADDVRHYGWRTLADALNSLRGFYTAYDRNYSYLGARGFLRSGDYNSRILLLIDGHRLNDNVYDGALLGTEFPLDLNLIDHIEVVRGPSSSLFGTNAVFGIVNVITREAGQGPRLEVSGSASSFVGRSAGVAGSFKAGDWSALLGGSLYRSDGHARLFFPQYASPSTNDGYAEDVDGDSYGHLFADVRRGNWRLQGLYGSRTKIIPTTSYGTIFNDAASCTTDARGYVDASYHRALSETTDFDLRTYYDGSRYHGSYPTAVAPHGR
jgi:iron complex outermembrane receptor protein